MTAIAAAAVFVGAALQSATGFGFALVSAPFLFAILGPREAVTAGVVLGLALNVLTLATEGRRTRILTGEAAALVAWALPGIVLGAIALRELPDGLLSAFVAIAVLSALGLRLRTGAQTGRNGGGSAGGAGSGSRRGAGAGAGAGSRGGAGGAGAARRWQTAVAGTTSGALSTSTSLSGPPLVFYLLARGAAPDQMRDTLAAIFIALSLLGVAALGLTGTLDLSHGVALLLAAGLAGQLLGRRGFALLGDRYETVVLIVLALTAVVALGSTVV